MVLSVEVKEGYLVSTDSGVIPLLGSTEKLLAVFGYAVPVQVAKLRENGLPAADDEQEIVFEPSTSDEDGVNNKTKKRGGKSSASASNKDAAATDSGEINDTSHNVPDKDLPFQGLKRIKHSTNFLNHALDDLQRWKHRDGSEPKSDGTSRDDNRRKALDSQREHLQKQLSGTSSSDEEIKAQQEQERERELTMVRSLNSMVMLTNVLLPMLLHERRKDQKLIIGKTKLEGKKIFLIGEFVYDVVAGKTCTNFLMKLKRILTLVIDTDFMSSEDKSCWNVWKPTMDTCMKSAAALLTGSTVSVPDHKDFIGTFLNGTSVNVGKQLDKKFEIMTAKDKAEHDKYLASIEALQKRIDGICKEALGKSCKVSVYGSCLSDLSLGKDADVDLSLHVNEAETLRNRFEAGNLEAGKYEKGLRRIIFRVCRAIEKVTDEFRSMQPVARARVPVVRGTWIPANNPHSGDGSINFDICLSNDVAVANSTLIKEYSLVDPRVRPLMLSIKRWAKDHNLSSAKDHSLSAYGWINLVLFYAQSLGLVPNLQSAELMDKAGVKPDASNKSHSIRNLDTFFLTWEQARSVWMQPKELDDLPVSLLLYGFFRFYSSEFPRVVCMVSAKRGGSALLPRTKFRKGSFFFCIEDPFETCDAHIQHDLSTPVGEREGAIIINQLRAAASHLDAVFSETDEAVADVKSLWPEPSSDSLNDEPIRRRGRAGRKGKVANQSNQEKAAESTNGRNNKSPKAKKETGQISPQTEQSAGIEEPNSSAASSGVADGQVGEEGAASKESKDRERQKRPRKKKQKNLNNSAADAVIEKGTEFVDTTAEAANPTSETKDSSAAVNGNVEEVQKKIVRPPRQGRGRGRGWWRGGRGRGRGGRGRSGQRASTETKTEETGAGEKVDRPEIRRGEDIQDRVPSPVRGGRGRRAGRGRGRGRGNKAKATRNDRDLMPVLPPGTTRKRDVLDILKELKEAGLNKRNILVRVDFNVPMNSQGAITDDSRIRGALPTIQVILQNKCNAILVSHMGRPKLVQKGEDSEEMRQEKQALSLRPVADHLGKLLNQSVLFAGDCLHAEDTIQQLGTEGGSVALLENLRFYKQEEKNDKDFAQTLASYADAYVNDAFGTCHRAHASTAGVPALLDPKLCGIGCLVAKELANLNFNHAADNDKMAAIIGGSKVSTKLPVIQGILKNADVLVLQGGLAFTFLKVQGISIGSSLLEESMVETAKSLLEQAKAGGKEIVMPVDAVCAEEFPTDPLDKAKTKTFNLSLAEGIPDGWMGLDIGPKSVELFTKKLGGAKKLVFNGPAGVFEHSPFDEGTRALVLVIAELTKNGTVSVVGGGESVAALEQFGATKLVSYVSTGGGATLELLADHTMPGIAAISDMTEG